MNSIRLVICLLGAFLWLRADDGGEALLSAARKGNLTEVRALLDKGVNVDSKSSYGQTALFFACDRGHTEIVKVLLDRGANVNVKDTFYNATALTWAASKDRAEVVKLLLAKGADGVDQVLAGAVQGGNKEMAKVALDTGKVKQNTLDYALSMAVKAKKDDFVEMLKQAGAKAAAPAPATVSVDVLNRYAGRYQGGRGGTETEVVFSVADGKLVMTSQQGEKLTFKPLSDTRFRGVEMDQIEVEFKARDGQVSGMEFSRGGYAMPFTRMVAK